MAFQQQGGMNGGPGGPGDHHAPQGTEYTLQGQPHRGVRRKVHGKELEKEAGGNVMTTLI